jgi:hypothetical protein
MSAFGQRQRRSQWPILAVAASMAVVSRDVREVLKRELSSTSGLLVGVQIA